MQGFEPGRDFTPFDLHAARRGARLNRLGHALRDPALRARFAAEPEAVLDEIGLDAEERAALAARDWRRMIALGASVYALAKIGGALGVPLPEIVRAGRG